MSVKDLLAQWAVIVGLTPLLDARAVEVVAFVAGEWRHHVGILKWHQAYHAFFMLAELAKVKHSGHLGKILTSFLSLQSTLFIIDSCMGNSISVLAAERIN